MSPSPWSLWRPHPWHGLDTGLAPPRRVNAYIELTPFDLVKYEIDKRTGYLRIDRPQRTSSQPPTLYGFIPRTYSGRRVGALAPGADDGDGDPLDVCVLSERPVTRAEVVVEARVIGGLPTLDGGKADDKILAVLESDPVWAGVEDLDALPRPFLDRVRHYFATYKLVPDAPPQVSVGEPYGRARAEEVVIAAMHDYAEAFPAAAVAAPP